jgi:hypothetical protein
MTRAHEKVMDSSCYHLSGIGKLLWKGTDGRQSQSKNHVVPLGTAGSLSEKKSRHYSLINLQLPPIESATQHRLACSLYSGSRGTADTSIKHEIRAQRVVILLTRLNNGENAVLQFSQPGRHCSHNR